MPPPRRARADRERNRELIVTAARALFTAAADHSLRPDLDPADVTLAVAALLATASTEEAGPRAHRLITLFIDGLARRD